MCIEIKDFDIFGKNSRRRIYRIKITEFGSRFAEKSSNKQERNFWKIKSRKIEIKIEIEIDSNYDSKMKSKA